MRTDKEITQMLPLFEQPPNQEWPQGVSAGDLLRAYLSGEKSREREALIEELDIHCRRAFDVIGQSALMPLFGILVVNCIVLLWMLGDDALLKKVVKIESDEDGIIKKLFLIRDAYFPEWAVSGVRIPDEEE